MLTCAFFEEVVGKREALSQRERERAWQELVRLDDAECVPVLSWRLSLVGWRPLHAL